MPTYFNEKFPENIKKMSCSFYLQKNHYITNTEEGLTHFISYSLSKNGVILRTRKEKKVLFVMEEGTIELLFPSEEKAKEVERHFHEWLIDDLAFKFPFFDNQGE